MQIISKNQTVRSKTPQDLNEFNSQSLATQDKKGEHLVSLMPAIKKAFDLMGDDIIEVSAESENSKNNLGSYVEKW